MSIYLKEKTLEKLKRERVIIHMESYKEHSECVAVIAFLKKQTRQAVWNLKESCVRAGGRQRLRVMGEWQGARESSEEPLAASTPTPCPPPAPL